MLKDLFLAPRRALARYRTAQAAFYEGLAAAMVLQEAGRAPRTQEEQDALAHLERWQWS